MVGGIALYEKSLEKIRPRIKHKLAHIIFKKKYKTISRNSLQYEGF